MTGYFEKLPHRPATDDEVQDYARGIMTGAMVSATPNAVGGLLARIRQIAAINKTLFDAIKNHHDQKADDRCVEDDDRLYEAAGLPPCDRRVGDKEQMLANCKRFIDQRCEGGGWPSYAELEAELAEWRELAKCFYELGWFPYPGNDKDWGDAHKYREAVAKYYAKLNPH